MKQTRLLMGMPITIEIVDLSATKQAIDHIYDYLGTIDERFSTYRSESEITKINAGLLAEKDYSPEMREIFRLAELTKKETHGFFDIVHNGKIDPSGIVKGYAIQYAADLLTEHGFENFFVDAGGDIQTAGKNSDGELWKIGIRNPFNRTEHIKIVSGENIAVATSGTAIRGQHIYNPFNPQKQITDIVSFTVIGDNIYDADRYATSAFAMGKDGIFFIEKVNGFEGYMIDAQGIATYTSYFQKYVI